MKAISVIMYNPDEGVKVISTRVVNDLNPIFEGIAKAKTYEAVKEFKDSIRERYFEIPDEDLDKAVEEGKHQFDDGREIYLAINNVD